MFTMKYSKYTLSLFLFQMSLSWVQSKRGANHYLYRLYKEEIRILENGTFPKGDVEKLERYKKEIENDEQMFRLKAWFTMNEDSRLYDEIHTKCYKRFKSRKRKRKKKALTSSEKWKKRVRFHYLQNFLLQNGFFLDRRNHHTTRPTTLPTTLLMLPYNTDRIIPNFMKKILPSNMFYKYYLPLTNIIKKVPGQIQTFVETCVDKFKRNSNIKKKRTQEQQNKTLHRYEQYVHDKK
uniref:Uncharacterized protein n=1 Tax=Cacopsylla melanoneura TaxID=428564 RepID=A0A8D9BF31_9HEMI